MNEFFLRWTIQKINSGNKVKGKHLENQPHVAVTSISLIRSLLFQEKKENKNHNENEQ